MLRAAIDLRLRNLYLQKLLIKTPKYKKEVNQEIKVIVKVKVKVTLHLRNRKIFQSVRVILYKNQVLIF